ncbi:MAG: hypothetical protein HQL31_07910 [Planctomycetes bacterium]|nr:hypothetical protein [Planctomycetota bacterium]
MKEKSNILQVFDQLRDLVSRQQKSISSFDAADAYSSDGAEGHCTELLQFYENAFADMGIGLHEEIIDWKFEMRFKGKGVIDSEALFALLRLLPDIDIKRIRLFNRFVSQETFRIQPEEIINSQQSNFRGYSNPFFDKLQQRVREFSELCGVDLGSEHLIWPPRALNGAERQDFIKRISAWRDSFVQLPGIRIAMDFFMSGALSEDKTVFSDFFHVQRQFDSDNWQDEDEERKPYPQPLPRITGYRKMILELNKEFTDAEVSISMCYDYCRLRPDATLSYIRSAEDAFVKIVYRLDDDYPLDVDFGHRELHARAMELKHMIFPLRCMFFEELDAGRGARESNDNTLDSYMDMTLVKTAVSVPPHYRHDFTMEDLEPELQECLNKMAVAMKGDLSMFKDEGKACYSSCMVISAIQIAGMEVNQSMHELLAAISLGYENKFKSDENNISRRMARLFYLFTGAMAKLEVMRSASQGRLDSIQKMSNQFAGRAFSFKSVDFENEGSYLNLKDDQLPLLASPDQMEDIFHTQKVVARMAEGNEEFEDVAKKIQQGLDAALEMLRRSEQFLEHLVKRMFPNEVDRIDLVKVIQKLIKLSYQAHQTLADAARKEALSKKKKKEKDGKATSAEDKEKEKLDKLKEELNEIRLHLQTVLGEKRKLVDRMRITDKERDSYRKQMRMIAMMTINSIKGNEVPPEAPAEAPSDDAQASGEEAP